MRLNLGKYKGKMVDIDLDKALNGNSLLAGKSGSGKTSEAEMMMCEICDQGGTVLALDLHETLAEDQLFFGCKEKFGGYTHNIDVYLDGISCGLLNPLQYRDGTEEKPSDTASAVASIFGRTLNLGCNQQGTLRLAIEYVIETGMYEKRGFCAVRDALDKIGSNTAKSMKERLYQVLSRDIFRPGDAFLQDGRINIIRLGKFDLETQEMLAELILSQLWRLAVLGRFKEKGIFLFIDEVQNLQCGKHSAVAQMLSEGRKFNVNLILATQQLMPGSASVLQQRLTQCALILYFQPDANRVNFMARMIEPLAENEWALILRSLKQGEFVATGTLSIEGRLVERPLKISAFVEAEEQEKPREMPYGRGVVRHL